MNMKRLFITSLVALFTLGVSAQNNMEAFKHLGVGVEAGLHGFGIDVAMPVYKGLVVKAGYNFVPSGDLFSTQFEIDTQDLKEAQEQYDALMHFQNKFGDEAVIDAGLQMNLSNLKLLLNWYPFKSGSLYLAGGVYYSTCKNPFLSIHGNTTENDWAALQELRQKTGNDSYEIALEIANEKYPVVEKDGCGYMQADFKMDPLKYYLGLGLGRCVPNKRVGLQFELGALFYNNAKFYLQDKEVPMADAAEQLGDAAKTAIGYMEKFPIYPQLALRLNFLAF
jgi:hypothetical protein